MRGALISTLSSPPEVTELDEPQAGSGEILVSIQAVALNPLDVNVGSGRVYLFGDGRGVTAPGFMAERVALPSELALALPDGVDPGLAAAARKETVEYALQLAQQRFEKSEVPPCSVSARFATRSRH
jgi:NADPH:quinone reductase-like Zn-dependent oxidoreductase